MSNNNGFAPPPPPQQPGEPGPSNDPGMTSQPEQPIAGGQHSYGTGPNPADPMQQGQVGPDYGVTPPANVPPVAYPAPGSYTPPAPSAPVPPAPPVPPAYSAPPAPDAGVNPAAYPVPASPSATGQQQYPSAAFTPAYSGQPEMNGGPAFQPGGQVPMGPGGMPVAPVPAKPSAFTLTLRLLWQAPVKIWKGKPLDALAETRQIESSTGNQWLTWLLVFGINSILAGLLWSTVIAKIYSEGVNALGSLFGSGAGYYASYMYGSLPFSTVLTFFFVFLLAAFASLVIRGTFIFVTNKVSGANTNYQSALNSWATAQTVLMIPMAVTWLLSLLGLFSTLWWLLLIFYLGIFFMVEVFVYLSVLKDGPHKISPLVPHAWFTTAAIVISALVLWILLRLFSSGIGL